jgi:hypothetical protein
MEISVLVLPDHERTATLKVTLPASWRAKTVGKLAAALGKRHAATLGRAPVDGVLWRNGAALDPAAPLGDVCRVDDGALAVSWVAAPPPAPPAPAAPPPAPARPAYPAFLSGGAVRRCRWRDEAGVARALDAREPVVLYGGGGLCRHLVGRWDLDYLAAKASGYAQFSLHFAPAACGAFPRIYGPGLGAGGIADASVAQFVAAARDPPPGQSVYLQIPLVHFEPDDPPFRTPRCGKVAAVGDPLLHDVDACDWAWLHRVAAHRGNASACQLWCGDGRGRTPLHYDESDNFLCQVAGRKHVSPTAPMNQLRGLPVIQ